MMSVKPPTLKDGLFILPYAVKAGAAILVACLAEKEIPPIAAGAVILALLNLTAIAALAFAWRRALKYSRRLAFGTEIASAAVLFILGGFHASRGGRGDEVGLVYFVLAFPLFLLALLNCIPFNAERKGPL